MRVIQTRVHDPLAEELIKGTISEGQTVTITSDGNEIIIKVGDVVLTEVKALDEKNTSEDISAEEE